MRIAQSPFFMVPSSSQGRTVMAVHSLLIIAHVGKKVSGTAPSTFALRNLGVQLATHLF
jgi:hypothetical protein